MNLWVTTINIMCILSIVCSTLVLKKASRRPQRRRESVHQKFDTKKDHAGTEAVWPRLYKAHGLSFGVSLVKMFPLEFCTDKDEWVYVKFIFYIFSVIANWQSKSCAMRPKFLVIFWKFSWYWTGEHLFRVVTKTRNGMERNGLVHPILLRILRPEAIQYLPKP